MIKRILLSFTIGLGIHYSNGQINSTNVDIVSKSPEASQMLQFGTFAMNMATGLPNINIPIHNFNYDGISIPISISYLANGIMVNDIASPVGLKWILNTGGLISREIIGFPDEAIGGWFEFEYTNDYIRSNECNQDFLSLIYSGNMEATPDRFSFDFLNFNGQFLFDNFKKNYKTEANGLNILYNSSGYTFKIIDPNGNEYYFGKKFAESTLLTIATPGSINNDGGGTTSWKLEKIVTPRGKVIELNYDSYSYSTGSYISSGRYIKDDKFNCSGGDLSIYHPNRGQQLTHTDISYDVLHISSITSETEEVKFFYSLDNSLSIMKRKLDSIQIINRNKYEIVKRVKFNYTKYAGDSRLKLLGISICSLDDTNCLTYNFEYDHQPLPSFGSSCQDVFGFINQNSVNHLVPILPPGEGGTPAHREIDQGRIQSGVLKEIRYPSGGKTFFEYEPNKESNTFFPGIRVKSITNKDLNDNEIFKREFLYFNPIGANQHTFGNYNNYKKMENMGPNRLYCSVDYHSQPVVTIERSSGFLYKKVIEKIKENGYMEEHFISATELFSVKPILSERIFFNKNHKKIKHEKYEYEEGNQSSFTGWRAIGSYPVSSSYIVSCNSSNFLLGPGSIFYEGLFSIFYNIYPYSRLKTKEIVDYFYKSSDSLFVDSLVLKESNEYNSKNFISQTKISNNNHEEKVIKYKYSIDYPSDSYISNLNAKNLIGIPLNTRIFKLYNNELKLVSGNTSILNSFGQPTQVNKWEGENPISTDFLNLTEGYDVFTKYISYEYDTLSHNIISREDRQSKYSYIYGYNNSLPVVVGLNIPNDTLINIVNASLPPSIPTIDDLLNTLSDPSEYNWKLFNNNLRIKINSSGVSLSTYTYNRFNKISSITDNNGLFTYYKYNEFGDLISITDHNANQLKTYDYHYYGSPVLDDFFGFKVDFNSQGGSSVTSLNALNTLISEPAPPSLIGYNFQGWFKESGCTTPWDFNSDTVTSDITLYAKWTIKTYSISATASVGGTVSPSGITTVNHGSPITYTITPALGFYIKSVTVNGVSVGAASSYTFSNVTSNQTISVVFAEAITVSPTDLVFGYNSGKKQISITFNPSITYNPAWSITSAEPWITVSPTSGSGNKTVTISVLPHIMNTPRFAEIVINCGGIDKTIHITQDSNPNGGGDPFIQ